MLFVGSHFDGKIGVRMACQQHRGESNGCVCVAERMGCRRRKGGSCEPLLLLVGHLFYSCLEEPSCHHEVDWKTHEAEEVGRQVEGEEEEDRRGLSCCEHHVSDECGCGQSPWQPVWSPGRWPLVQQMSDQLSEQVSEGHLAPLVSGGTTCPEEGGTQVAVRSLLCGRTGAVMLPVA